MKSATLFLSCAVVVGLSVASPGRALADPIIILQPVAVGSVNALNGQIFTQDFQTFISSNNSNQFSAILEFDLLNLGGPTSRVEPVDGRNLSEQRVGHR